MRWLPERDNPLADALRNTPPVRRAGQAVDVPIVEEVEEEYYLPSHVCADCGTVAEPITLQSGSMALEIIMWIVFLPVGVIYSLWRWSTKGPACKSCHSRQLVPTGTKRGQRIIDDYS